MKRLLFALAMIIALPAQAAGETAFERVTRTGTLRCGYIILPPEMEKDVNTGVFSGLSYDITMEAAKRLNLTVEWTEEVNFQTLTTGLKTGRYDAVCFSLYRYSVSAPHADYSIPLFYSSTGAWVRTDDTRFSDPQSLNSADVTIATVDGEMSQFIAASDFPQAKTLSMPQMTDLSQLMLAVETGKADVTFVSNLAAAPYLKAHPDKLRNITKDRPVRIFSHGLAFPKGQYDLVRMFDVTLQEMQDHGVMDKILNKYDPTGATHLRVAKPYRDTP